jgi:HSP20 family protein
MPRDIDRLQSEIAELFSDLWQVPRYAGIRRYFRPAVDVYRRDAELRIVIELPGVAPESVELVTSGRKLLLAGDRERPKTPGSYEQMEIEYGRFERTVSLPVDVDTNAASAEYENGMLTIVLPLAQTPPAEDPVPIQLQAR